MFNGKFACPKVSYDKHCETVEKAQYRMSVERLHRAMSHSTESRSKIEMADIDSSEVDCIQNPEHQCCGPQWQHTYYPVVDIRESIPGS